MNTPTVDLSNYINQRVRLRLRNGQEVVRDVCKGYCPYDNDLYVLKFETGDFAHFAFRCGRYGKTHPGTLDPMDIISIEPIQPSRTSDITVTFNIEEHHAMRELLCLASAMIEISKPRLASKYETIKALEEKISQLWSDRFTENES